MSDIEEERERRRSYTGKREIKVPNRGRCEGCVKDIFENLVEGLGDVPGRIVAFILEMSLM
jgi:hypothetical protein